MTAPAGLETLIARLRDPNVYVTGEASRIMAEAADALEAIKQSVPSEYPAMSRPTLEHHAGWLAKECARLTELAKSWADKCEIAWKRSDEEASQRLAAHFDAEKRVALVEAEAYRRCAEVCRDHPTSRNLMLADTIAALAPSAAQSVEEMRRDAERYRWLRTFNRNNLFVIKADPAEGDTALFEEPLDAAIDAAALQSAAATKGTT